MTGSIYIKFFTIHTKRDNFYDCLEILTKLCPADGDVKPTWSDAAERI